MMLPRGEPVKSELGRRGFADNSFDHLSFVVRKRLPPNNRRLDFNRPSAAASSQP